MHHHLASPDFQAQCVKFANPSGLKHVAWRSEPNALPNSIPCHNCFTTTEQQWKNLMQPVKSSRQPHVGVFCCYLCCTGLVSDITVLSQDKVLLQYYSVLQSTNPVLLCTTMYYSEVELLLVFHILPSLKTK